MKRVLITGANSYIGMSFEQYVAAHYSSLLSVNTLDMIDGTWRQRDFSAYDIVYHVAGIAHADVGSVSEETKAKYYAINTDLAIETAKKAKAEGVKQFVFMSSAIVYGDSAPYGKTKRITIDTEPQPSNFYGDSKWQADKGIRELADDEFAVTVLRPPMIYGKGSKGNYPTLAKMAKKLPIFPNVQNERSMLYIENLCEFLCQVMIRGEKGVFWPQNAEYTNTSEMVKMIGDTVGHKIHVSKGWNWLVAVARVIPGKPKALANKAFGNFVFAQEMSVYNEIHYQNISLKASIIKTESRKFVTVSNITNKDLNQYSVLMSVYKNDNDEYLRIAIESMLNQSYPPEQFVIVEDGPISNNLKKTLANYSILYPKLFTFVVLSENGGLGNALNHGVEKCRNELIARMDSDDISKPERCEKQIDAFRDNPQLGIVGTQIDEFIDDISNVVSKRIVPTSHSDIVRFARRRSPFNHPTVMYRKSIIEQLGGYIPYGRKEDLDLFVRAVNSGVYTKNLDESLLYYRTSTENLKRRKTWINCKEYIQIMKGFKKQGFISNIDYLYVLVGQLCMFILPDNFVRILSDKLLREKC